MGTRSDLQTWEAWYPEAASTGLLVARARIDPTTVAWLHAAPKRLAVIVRDGDDRPIASADGLPRSGDYLPMTRLEITGETLVRQDRWPIPADLGSIVILPGGEAGVLQAWWNAEDGSEWRWSVEFRNQR
jgi:hypothetical protein